MREVDRETQGEMMELNEFAKLFGQQINDYQEKMFFHLFGSACTSHTENTADTAPTYEKLMQIRRNMMLNYRHQGQGYGSYRVYASYAMTKQFRFPRSKRARIQKKWRKDIRNFKPSNDVFVDKVSGVMYCHPQVEHQLKQAISKRNMN